MDARLILQCAMHQGFPARLREAREAKNLKPTALAVAAGLARDVARILERDSGRIPRLITVEQFAKTLGVCPAWLAFGAEPNPEAASKSAEFGKRLAAARSARGLSLRDLAGRVGTTPRRICYLERGEYTTTIQGAEKLALALRVKASWLAFGVRKPSSG